MTRNPIYVTQTDADKIRELLREAEHSGYRGSIYIQKLKAELERAEIIPPQDVPPDLITLNTTALLLDADTAEQMKLTLVSPEHADLSQGRISILAPIGAAMLGYKLGDTFEWDTPGGKRTLRVEKIIPNKGAA
jgi:regulator of nucleoside diphosphate kinase